MMHPCRHGAPPPPDRLPRYAARPRWRRWWPTATSRSVCLDLDWFFAKLRSGAIEPWREEAHAQNRVVLHAAAEAWPPSPPEGYVSVAEGILYPFMLDLFAAACARNGSHSPLRGAAGADRGRAAAGAGPHGRARSTRARWPMPSSSTTSGPSSRAWASTSATGSTWAGAARTRWPRRSTAGSGPASSGSRPRVRSRRRRAAAWWCCGRGPCRRSAAGTCRTSRPLPRRTRSTWSSTACRRTAGRRRWRRSARSPC